MERFLDRGATFLDRATFFL